MGHWVSFTQAVMDMLRSTSIMHEVSMNKKNESYVVGCELGLSGRFVRNLCDPVIQALILLPEMYCVRFGDIQALTSGGVVPDIAFDPVVDLESSSSIEDISLVGEFKTPWTVAFEHVEINRSNPHPRFENVCKSQRSEITVFWPKCYVEGYAPGRTP